VRPVLVVVQRVGYESVVEVAAAEDQQPVEALAADAGDRAFGMRSRLRRPHGPWGAETRPALPTRLPGWR
jgi:hypothetical protein